MPASAVPSTLLKQHGFLKGRSTSTNRVEFASQAIKVEESDFQLDAIFTIRHNIHVKNLSHIGVHSETLR